LATPVLGPRGYVEIFFPLERMLMGKGGKQGADKPALVGPRGPVSGGGGGATSRREAALPKNEVPTRRLKTYPSALEHGKEWRNILLLRPKNGPSPAKNFGRRRRILRHGKAAGESIRSIQRIPQYTRSKARCVVVGLARLAPNTPTTNDERWRCCPACLLRLCKHCGRACAM
jgi:hypothetical protein